jgi:biopolymer transport protein ExbD
MMDILTVLLLFLLKSFVVEGEALTPPPGMELPTSTSQDLPGVSIHIAILEDGILVGDELAATGAEVEASGFVIPGLAAALDRMQAQSERIARLKGVEPPEARRATVQGDKSLEFRVVEKVMFTLAGAGYSDVSLAVIKKS